MLSRGEAAMSARNGRVGWLRLCVLAALAAFGCSRKESPVEGTATASAAEALNPSPQVRDFVLFATNSMALGANAIANDGDVGVKNIGAGPFLVSGYELAVGSGTQSSTSRNLLADSVLLAQYATVGSVQTNHLADQGATHGTETAFVAMPDSPVPATVTPGTTAHAVPSLLAGFEQAPVLGSRCAGPVPRHWYL